MSALQLKSARRGATFIVWLMLIGTVFFGVIASLLSGESAQYGRAVEEARSREALYLAEGGLARALLAARAGELNLPRKLQYDHGRGRVTVTVEPGESPGEWRVRSTAAIRQARREWRESVAAQISGVGSAAQLTKYHWTQNYD